MTETTEQSRKTFPDISSRAWEHPADRIALTALRRLRGFDQALKVVSGLMRERKYRLLYLANGIKTGPRQFSDLDTLLDECVRILDAPTKPELFVTQSSEVNAYCIGMDEPFIVVTSGMYELLSHEEMRAVVGHELGHALSGHAVYRTMLMHLQRLAASFGFMPIGGWALRAIVAALMEWQRKSELSADRAGLLCCQHLDTAIRVDMKLAGGARLDKLDTQAFLAQAREYERGGDMRDGVLKLLNLELRTHPFSVLRAAALTRWVDSGEYGKVIAGRYPLRSEETSARWTDDVGDTARHYRGGFDVSEDPLIRGLRDGLSGIVGTVGRKLSEWRGGQADG